MAAPGGDRESFFTLVQILRNIEPSALEDLNKYVKSLDENRHILLSKYINEISNLKTKLVNVKGQIKEDYTMELRDADYYRTSMFQIEGKISQIKEKIKQELCDTLNVEIDLTSDLQILEKRVEEWSKMSESFTAVPKSNNNPVINSRTDEADQQNPNECLAKFLSATGGKTGGWQEQDHFLFLRERRKYKGKDIFIDSVHKQLPDLSIKEITNHEQWFKKFEELKGKQREAIKKWKAQRLNKHTSEEEEAAPETPIKSNFQGKRDITERIKEWKRQQQLKKEIDEQRQQELRRQLYEERMKKRRAEKAKRAAVEEYKTEKLNKLRAMEISRQMQQLKALEERTRKNVSLKVFRELDLEYMDKKRLAKAELELKEQQRVARLERVASKVVVQADRDPLRILQPTHGWTQRCMQSQQSTPENFANMGLQNIPKLAVPSWRKGLQNVP